MNVNAATSEPKPPRPPLRWKRALASALASLVFAIALLLALSWWIVGSTSGTAWLLHMLPGISVTAPTGSLLGDFSAERVELALPGAAAGAGDRIVVSGLRWRGLSLAWPAAPTAWLRVDVESLHGDRVDLLLTPDPDAPPLAPPLSLQLPLELELQSLQITELRATPLGDRPLQDLRARLQLGADGGRTHRVDDLAFGWDRVAAHGAARIGSVAPFTVESRLAIGPRAAPDDPPPIPFDATLAASGPLEKLVVRATLRGTVGAGNAPAPSLDVDATVQPFAPWPLAALQAQTRALDLAALHSSAPGTSLTGSAQVESAAMDRPATVTVALGNARAGRFDEGLLPIRSLAADLRARPDDPQRIEIRTFELMLGTLRESGGRVSGAGNWTPQSVALEATLTDVAPRVLDARAPPTRLSGRTQLQANDWLAGGSAQPSLTLRGRIEGSLPRDGQVDGVQLELDASATLQRVDVRKATLRAGASLASFAGHGQRQGGAWQVAGKGTISEFKPAQWWPGSDGSAWRKGTHRFNGAIELDLRVPANASPAAQPALQRLATSQGQATLRLSDSRLAGTPLSGELALHGEGAAGLDIRAALDLAGAKLGLRGRLAPDARDHWSFDAHAADLAPLAPLLELLRPSGSAAPVLAGAADAEASIDGRWPHLGTRGKLSLTDARASDLKVARAGLSWTLGTAEQAPLDVKIELAQLGLGVQKLDSLQLTVQGTAADHRIALDAASPVRPPRWVELLQGVGAVAERAPQGATGTLAELRAQGALQFDAAWQQPLRWRGQLQQIQARQRAGAPAAPWFRAGGSELAFEYDPLTGTPQASLSPGRLELSGMALRWSALHWRGGSTPLLDAQAEVEPFSVAPLLTKLQPDLGWGGNLVVGGKLSVRSAPTFTAEVVFGRERGDLNITDETGTQALELTDLRLALDASDGVWNFTYALAGRTLGAMAGAATARTDARAFWPPPSAPLQGVMELRIANLGAWGAWVPAGWRLKGALHASASLGGQFGAPEYTGRLDGSGLGARNLLEGVDLQDGELDIVLEGETARIVTLRARAGEGSLQVSGGATFGAVPSAQLRFVAERLLLLGRVDRRMVVSADATLQLAPRSLQLNGRVDIDQGLIDISRGNAPSLGDDVRVLREPATAAGNGGSAGPSPATLRDVKVELALDLGKALRLRGRGLDTLLRGQLMLTTPEGRLALNGTVNAVQGTYAAYGQKLEIERGAITFSGAPANPRLDILALRPNLDLQVGVAISGTATAPRISLYSEPNLPENEKLSWLVLGRAPEGLGGSDIALLQAAAVALLAGEGDAPGSELTRVIGLDTLSVRQTDGEVRSTVLSVGKQLSKRWYIGYERSLSATAGNWQLIYRIAQRFTLRLQTGLDNSIDLIWTWRWD